jgi:hypothetical protein
MKTLQISILISEFGSCAPGENPSKIIMFLVFVQVVGFDRVVGLLSEVKIHCFWCGNSNAGESQEGVLHSFERANAPARVEDPGGGGCSVCQRPKATQRRTCPTMS